MEQQYHTAAVPEQQFNLTLEDSPRQIDGESPRRARTLMVRRPLRQDAERSTQSASGRAKNVIVAHGVHPGQTIELAHGEKATLSDVEADRRQRTVTHTCQYRTYSHHTFHV